MSEESRDRIADKVRLHASRERVWRALADPEEFGQWFGVKGLGPFVPGTTVRGMITDKGYEHVPFEIAIERMEPGRMFSFRWHPYAVDPAVDYTGEPRTLVVFELEEVEGGTLLSVVETGFGRLPPGRRAEAYPMHEEGWAAQMKAIERHLAEAA